MTCFIDERIAEIKEGKNPNFIAELRESYVVLYNAQVYEGYCVVMLKEHVDHLETLPIERQLDLYRDMMDVARAIKKVFNPVRMNYAQLANTVPHIHWHVTPRYANDPGPTQPIWVRPKEEREMPVTPERRDALIKLLRQELGTQDK